MTTASPASSRAGPNPRPLGRRGGEGRTVTLRAGSLAVGLREGEDWTAEFSSGGRLLASGPPRAVAHVTGPRWVGERHDAGTLPLYARQGSVLPISSRLDRPESDWADGLALRCFALVDGEEREVVVPAHDGYDAVVFRVTRRGGALAARATGARGPWALEAKACAPRRRAPGPGRPSRSPSGSSETAARRRAGSPSASPSAGPCPARGLTPTRSSGTSPGGRRGRRARAPSRSGAAAPRADRRAARRRSR